MSALDASTEPLRVAVVYGSVRAERKGIRAARFVVRELEARGHAVTLVDALDVGLPLLDRTFRETAEGGREGGPPAPDGMADLAATYRASDVLVFVTGEYNHGLPAALKTLIDPFLAEFLWRPAGIVSYSAGSFGGVRAAVHLRAVLGEVGLVTLPSMLPVPRVQEAFGDDGVPAEPEAWARRTAKFFGELAWYGRALRAARAAGVPY